MIINVCNLNQVSSNYDEIMINVLGDKEVLKEGETWIEEDYYELLRQN